MAADRQVTGPRGRGRRRAPAAPLWPALMVAGAIALLAVALFALWQGSAGAKSAPAAIRVNGSAGIRVDKAEVNLGDVKLGRQVEASFQVINVGDKPLTISEKPYIEVIAGCWPPEPTIGAMVLQPGESTTVSMQFLMHGNMGGPHDFRVHVKSDDPRQPDQTVDVLSNWVP